MNCKVVNGEEIVQEYNCTLLSATAVVCGERLTKLDMVVSMSFGAAYVGKIREPSNYTHGTGTYANASGTARGTVFYNAGQGGYIVADSNVSGEIKVSIDLYKAV